MASFGLTPEERIRGLSSISADVADMLNQAGQALNALTNRPLIKGEDEDGDADMSDGQHTSSARERQEAFKQHTTAFYTAVQSVTARLRRDVYALEEAGIVSTETTSSQANARQTQLGSGAQSGRPKQPEPAKITNGGLGNLDVGWLNSKGNKVGAEKENELMKEAKELLEDELKRRDVI